MKRKSILVLWLVPVLLLFFVVVVVVVNIIGAIVLEGKCQVGRYQVGMLVRGLFESQTA